jgi:hypothetical protein
MKQLTFRAMVLIIDSSFIGLGDKTNLTQEKYKIIRHPPFRQMFKKHCFM